MKMKKILMITTALALVLTLAACGQQGADGDKTTTEAAATEAASVTETAPTTTAKISNRTIEMKAYDVEVPISWSVQKRSDDPNSLIVFSISDSSKVKDNTPRISFEFLSGDDADFDAFIKENSAKKGKNLKIADADYASASYTKDDVVYTAYQATVGKQIVRISKIAVTDATAKTIDDIANSISFK